MRVSFSELFIVSEQGIRSREPVEIGGIILTPQITAVKGYRVGGINLEKYVGRDVEIQVDQIMEIKVIKGFY